MKALVSQARTSTRFRIDLKLSRYQNTASGVTDGITIDRLHIERVLTVLQQQVKRCPLEEVVWLCPDLRRDQVFFGLSRDRVFNPKGAVCSALDVHGAYWVWV
ncbi:MAG: hypothetical protein LV473_23095 [Nitrospira sp.]|nr:hypothetical protein [Nitrospira sp.]